MTAKIKLNAASGGGSISIQAPSSSSNNRVIALPDIADGTLVTSQSTLDATKLSGNLPAISGAALTGVPSNLKHLSTTTLSSNASTVIISNAFNQYDVYRLYIINVKSTSNDTNLFAKLQDSSGDIAASYHRSRASHAIEANFSNWGEWRLNYAGIANGSNKSWNAIIDYSGSFASPPLRYVGLTSYQHHSDGDPEGDYVNGCYDGTVTNLTGIKFYFSSGSFSGNGGKFMLYGVDNA